MFTGIIESLGKVKRITKEGSNIHFDVTSSLASELKIDQSLSHNGVCLTVVAVNANEYRVTAIDETLQKTNLGKLTEGALVNLERCMAADGRFDGHIVQGHVDQTGVLQSVDTVDGSWVFTFSYDAQIGNVTVEKGSICVNGTSLTCFDSKKGLFSVAIIPYTYENTNFHLLQPGDIVNLEFDIIGKYIHRVLKGY
ncbi:riboflavin synthase [uncultured Cyclobacterium sp.]|uniref:riboflavin synthase n=1 Tax=uncultured Cyclobacterium sp. TaxID=453820 RepID=UPI0030EBF07B|tara:strand:- start:24646 stop:25233 length:588 start_codon:yes stop_codon:yes gene_type:complete